MGNLTLIVALAGGTFDRINCQHNFDPFFEKSQMPERRAGKGGGVDWRVYTNGKVLINFTKNVRINVVIPMSEIHCIAKKPS